MLFRGQKWTTEAILAKIGGRRVRSLELYNTQADDDLLLALADAGNLTSLDVSSALITDVGVTALMKNCGLRSLMFREAPLVTDRSMVEISGCKTLTELYLEGTSVTDAGIVLVNSLPELWSLVVSRTQVTDYGISRIASKTIRLFMFDESIITGLGFSTWSVTEKMSIYTKNSLLNDEGFSAICQSFPYLWNIVMEYTKVTNLGLEGLAGQPVQSIRLNGSKIDRDGVIWLIENTEIALIEVDPNQLTKADAKSFQDYKRRLRIIVHD